MYVGINMYVSDSQVCAITLPVILCIDIEVHIILLYTLYNGSRRSHFLLEDDLMD